ncbi:M23 family metallopeptidase [Planktothrix agardhii]|uniref:M23 family metallopeptidase n=1 Tax=Planktothrix agardhii TaxID=1160 RepID=UPI0004293F7B|nr:M23 family metallopeptidase [Planktothrix agardhii]
MFEVNPSPQSANAITSLAETNAFLAEQVMPKVYQQLQLFASDPTFLEQLKLPFGDTWDIQKAQTLATEWLTGNFSTLAPIKIVTSADIKGASGAFADTTNQIYLAEDILTGSNVNQAVSVVLEEIGHSIDSRLNSSDSLGDEGEIFANIVQGKVLSPEQIQTLKSEDDATVVILDGETVVLEMNLQADWYVWRYSDWRKNDGNVDWFNPDGNTIQKGNRPDGKDGIYINWGLGSPFDASNISDGNNSDYFAVAGSAFPDFEAGKTYKFTVNADDGIILTAQPKDQKLTINGVITPYDTAQNKYAWQKYDDNNPQAKEYNFTPDQTGTYRVNFWSYDITGNASVDISWEEGSQALGSVDISVEQNGSTVSSGYYSQLSSLTDSQWDEYSGDSTRFTPNQYDDGVNETQLTPPDINQIYKDISKAALGNENATMFTGYAFDKGYNPTYGAHAGIDIGATQNQVVKALVKGKIADIGNEGSNGYAIAVDETDANGNPMGRRWWYVHLASPGNWKIGDSVEVGSSDFGKVNSSQGHLHLSATNVRVGNGWASVLNGNQNLSDYGATDVTNRTMSPLHAFWKSKNNISG